MQPRKEVIGLMISRIVATAVFLLGVVLRGIMYFQNRDLIIDEINVVRNLYERNFAELLKPLDYEQYAPPVFLWIEEILSLFFGYGAMSLKLFPLFCGIALMIVLYFLLKKIIDERLIWLPLVLVAVSPYLIEFSTVIKQYISDCLIVLLLIYSALKIDLFNISSKRFVFYWSLLGILAIYTSMPAVFALTGVGFYYAWQSIKEKKFKLIYSLIAIAAIWLAAFAIYYFLILKPQIQSDYLQNYHFDYFLYALPENAEEWKHNWMRIRELINNTVGYSQFNFFIGCIFLIIGAVAMLAKKTDKFILIFTPVLLTLIAAALNQFSLIMRVSLFLLPLFLIIISFGLQQLWQVKSIIPKAAIVFAGWCMVDGFNKFDLFKQKHGFHEFTEGMNYLLSKKVKGENLYVHHASTPTYIFYTSIDPGKERYTSLLGAHLMNWDSDYTLETQGLKDTTYFIYTGGFPDEEKQKRTGQIAINMQQIDYFEKYICFVYGYIPKKDSSENLDLHSKLP